MDPISPYGTSFGSITLAALIASQSISTDTSPCGSPSGVDHWDEGHRNSSFLGRHSEGVQLDVRVQCRCLSIPVPDRHPWPCAAPCGHQQGGKNGRPPRHDPVHRRRSSESERARPSGGSRRGSNQSRTDRSEPTENRKPLRCRLRTRRPARHYLIADSREGVSPRAAGRAKAATDSKRAVALFTARTAGRTLRHAARL
jgi:hypothetical protein